ncbi:hypothetical protein GCM10010885_15450 [Alicyclobacillus cellulosilyticus]|uniref:DUF488 family protein n=2 Tax=Alicyclobacillus cellulosilyticus TaxID=1003997 RepID=A0A917KCZ5_9BACL|nr:hypothetical protein GCM10010885_15450 [Alicyclobacillus cellulosilyticus]
MEMVSLKRQDFANHPPYFLEESVALASSSLLTNIDLNQTMGAGDMLDIRVKRVYASPAEDDGWRVLVDRLWPRGLAKDKAHWHVWYPELAPSPELRRWFQHDPARFQAFQQRYLLELNAEPVQQRLSELRARASLGPVTLLFAARDETHNHAVVLRDRLLGKV